MPDQPDIVLDGSAGEGGGQILRTALSLSAITGKSFAVRDVRARRIKPGLRPQHREAVLATARLCDAEVSGAEIGSADVTFRPRAPVQPGQYLFDIGTAGSTPLLFQTLCWPLALAGARSEVTLRGGTHQQYSPTFHDLALVWAPSVARLGFQFHLALQVAGFYPEGGGEITAVIDPAHSMPALDLRHRGTLEQVEIIAMVAGAPFSVAERLTDHAARKLRDHGIVADATRVPVPVRRSSGNHLLIVASFERTRAGFGALGDRGQTPERAADDAVAACASFLERGSALERNLGDQLVLPAALVAAGLLRPPPGVVPLTRYTVSSVTKHLLTNADVVQRFLPVRISVNGAEGDEGEVEVVPLCPGPGPDISTAS